MYKDNKLRLLMQLVGFQRLGLDDDPEASWIIPSSISASELTESIDLIRKFEFDPPIYENGKTAEDFLRSKAAARRRRASFDDDSEGEGGSQGEEDFEFPAGGPTTRKSDALEELKNRRRRRRRSGTQELDDEEKDRRAEARRKADLEKRRKIKSDMFVHDSDDETDDERDKVFFAKEEEIREAAGRSILKALTEGISNEKGSKKRKSTRERKKSRKRRKESELESEADDSGGEDDAVSISSKASSARVGDMLELDSDVDEATDTPFSSQQHGNHTSDRDAPVEISKPASVAMEDAIMLDEENEIGRASCRERVCAIV